MSVSPKAIRAMSSKYPPPVRSCTRIRSAPVSARDMAESGYSAMDILLYFYENCDIKNVYE